MEYMKRDTKTLFELPNEENKKLWQREGEIEGFGRAFILYEEQKLETFRLFLSLSLSFF
jgi:hypothetical protein